MVRYVYVLSLRSIELSLTDGRNETNTGTSDQTTNNQQGEARGRGLEDTSNREDQAAGNDGPSTTNEIGQISSNDGSEEGTAGENTGEKGLLPSW